MPQLARATERLEHAHGAAALDAPLLHHQPVAPAGAGSQAHLEGALADDEHAVALAHPVAADAAVEREAHRVGGDGRPVRLHGAAEAHVAAAELDDNLRRRSI